jgi:hypothetical protein
MGAWTNSMHELLEHLIDKALEAGVDGRDIGDYLAASLSRLKPWDAEGISRRTWERRQNHRTNRQNGA